VVLEFQGYGFRQWDSGFGMGILGDRFSLGLQGFRQDFCMFFIGGLRFFFLWVFRPLGMATREQFPPAAKRGD
jgi:hypothetical protein